MTETTYLTKEQIDGLIIIIERDYIQPSLDSKMKEIEESEDYKRVSEEIKNSDDFKQRLVDTETEYKNNLKLRELYLEIDKIDSNILSEYDYNKPWQLTATEEYINEIYQENISNINNIKSEVLQKLNINVDDWYIKNSVKQDLIGRLRLTSSGNFDELIESMKKHINIDKYLYNKTI